MTVDLMIREQDFSELRARPGVASPLAPARCAWQWICFRCLANNITYAFGDAGSYWRFSPAAKPAGASCPCGASPSPNPRRRGRGRAAVRLLAHGLARGDRRPRFAAAPDGRRTAPHRAAAASPISAARRVLVRRQRSRAGGAAAAVHHLVAGGRLSDRQRLLWRAVGRPGHGAACPARPAKRRTAPLLPGAAA